MGVRPPLRPGPSSTSRYEQGDPSVNAGRACRGTSLLEVVFAVTLIGTACLAVAASVLESSSLQKSNEQTRAITPLLVSLLDEVRATPFGSITPNYSGVTRTLPAVSGAPTQTIAAFTVADVPTGHSRWFVKKVTVQVTWTGVSGPTTVRGSTFVSDRNLATLPEAQ